MQPNVPLDNLSFSRDNLDNLDLSSSKDNSNSSTFRDNSLLNKLLEEEKDSNLDLDNLDKKDNSLLDKLLEEEKDSDLNNLDNLDNSGNSNNLNNNLDNKNGEAIKDKENSLVIKYKKLIELRRGKRAKREKGEKEKEKERKG